MKILVLVMWLLSGTTFLMDCQPIPGDPWGRAECEEVVSRNNVVLQYLPLLDDGIDSDIAVEVVSSAEVATLKFALRRQTFKALKAKLFEVELPAGTWREVEMPQVILAAGNFGSFTTTTLRGE